VRAGFELTWSDEFEGPAGADPNPTWWKREVGGHGWGNRELQYYTDRPDNARLAGDGTLEIVAREQAFHGARYTSARLATEGRFEFGHGRFEARIQPPAGRGLWPAFWLLGADFASVGWPACGEIDIMEMRGEEPHVVVNAVHGPGYAGALGLGGSFALEEGSFAGDFHVFAVEVDPGHIAFHVDDQLVRRLGPEALPAGVRWAFDQPFFVILNLAVGGDFLAPPDATTPFPAVMRVDYVRVYRRTSPASAA